MTADAEERRARLSDSEATLRQVRGVLTDFAGPDSGGPLSDVDRAIGERDAGGSAASEELHDALSEISRIRHEMNNHLTSALAEVQILLMDVECAELRESYEIIQRQLRSMRASVASTGHLRP